MIFPFKGEWPLQSEIEGLEENLRAIHEQITLLTRRLLVLQLNLRETQRRLCDANRQMRDEALCAAICLVMGSPPQDLGEQDRKIGELTKQIFDYMGKQTQIEAQISSLCIGYENVENFLAQKREQFLREFLSDQKSPESGEF